MDFDEIADRQGWTPETMLTVTRSFISHDGRGEALAEYAQTVADEENGISASDRAHLDAADTWDSDRLLRHLDLGHGIDPNTVTPGDERARHTDDHHDSDAFDADLHADSLGS